MSFIQTVTLVTLATLLIGCVAGGSFVSVDRKFRETLPLSGYHQVKRGETLYSIAFTYGFDYRELARANSIYAPFTIYPGQKIKVDGTRNTQISSTKHTVGKPTPAPVVTQSTPSTAKVSPVNIPPEVSNSATPDWKWPANGRLISQFSASNPVNKGIDLAGSLGESVFAATAGTVVYAGQGLRGYGNLVIVKHDDTYLSAYAHASRILVSEQEIVKVGQKIAEIGSTGTDKVMLHFEIRQNGKPVDPLQFLPKRTGGEMQN